MPPAAPPVRRFVLTFCLLAPAAAAQPTAADSALVERLLIALRFDLADEVMGEMSEGITGQVKAADPGAAQFLAPFMGALTDTAPLVDSVRAAFLADPRPDLARDALAFLEGPVMRRVAEHSPFQPGQFDYGQMMALLEDPGDQPLADSALAARYAEALMAANQPPELQRHLTQALWDAFPDEIRTAIHASVGKEQFFEMTQAPSTAPEQQAVMVQAARLSLGGVEEADVQAVTAYFESEAGRYVQGVAAEGAANAYLPRMIEGMRPAFQALVTKADHSIPPPPAPPARSGGVFEVADVQPELIGGLAALQQAVEYPEAARRAGIEGRVIVQFVVDEEGRVTDPVALQSPSPLLTDAALAAARSLRFRPGMDGGAAVKVRFSLPITFRLTDPEPTVEEAEVDEIELDLAGLAPRPEPATRVIQEEAPQLIGGLAGLAQRTTYPEAARRDGVEGRVVVTFIVTEEGRVEDPAVLSSPDPRLSRAALAAVRDSRFEPGRQEGEPVRVRFSLPVDFSLR